MSQLTDPEGKHLAAHDGHTGAAKQGPASGKRRPPTTPQSADPLRRQDPAVRITAFICAGAALLMAVVIAASFLNRANYYIETAAGAVEIWQGRFAPIGKERLHILPGAQPPPFAKVVYDKTEINTVIFNYYIDKAEILLEAPDMPDFNGIRFYLETAMAYGVTDAMRQTARSRLNRVDMMVYLYKADVAASKGTLSDFQRALAHIEQAAALDLNASQFDLVNKKMQSIKELMADVRNKPIAPSERPAGAAAAKQGSQPEPSAPGK